MNEFKLRTVRKESTNEIYILREDVAALIRETGATEETDVRDRLEQLAQNLERLK